MYDYNWYWTTEGDGTGEQERKEPEEEHEEKVLQQVEEWDDEADEACIGGCYPLIDESEDEEDIGHDVNCSGCHSGKCQKWISAATIRKKYQREQKSKKRNEERCAGSLCPVDPGGNTEGDKDMEMRKLKIYIDSGAADTVCPKDFHPGGEVRETAESKRGKYYLAANNSRIPVHGRKTIQGVTDDWNNLMLEAEVADVRRAFGVCEKIV